MRTREPGATKPKRIRKVKPAGPVSDARSSGRGYGIPKATAYNKRNVTKLQTVRSVTPGVKPRQVAVVYHPLAHPSPDLLSAKSLAHAYSWAVNHVYGRAGGGKGGGSASIAAVPGNTIVSRAVIDTGSEAARHPGATVKGFGNMVAGTVGGIGQVALPAVQGHPKESLRAAGRLAKGIPKDYAYRYGPLLAGNEKLYKQRLHETTAAPGLLDIGLAATGGAKVVRPATRAAFKATPKGRAILEAPRPKLRTSGGEAVTQTVSHKPLRAVAQRAQDKARVAAERLPSRRPDEQGRVPALQPKNPVRKSVERHNRKVARKGGTPVTVPRTPEEVVPILTGKHTFNSTGTGRAQRIAVSRESARSYIANKHEQATELNQGIGRGVASLSRSQRRAVFHVTQGLVPIHGSLEQIKTALTDREKQLVGAGAPKGAPILRPHAELATVRYLLKHADEVFGPGRVDALRAFHAAEVARGRRVRVGDEGVRPATAEARMRRPQGETLGIKYDPPKVEGKVTPEQVDAYNLAYAERVRKAADARGLPEPAYFRHDKRLLSRVSNRTAANLSRAVKGPAASEMRLFNEGRAMTDSSAYTSGVADTIKRKHQWQGVARATDQHAFDWSRGKDGKGLTVEELYNQLDKHRLRPDDVTFISPGRVFNRVNGSEAAKLIGEGHATVKTKGYFAVPRAAGDEITANAKSAPKGLRLAGKVQGLQSAAILGLNPSWVQMQLAANTLQTTVGVHGNLADVVRSADWYRTLKPAERKMVDRAVGVGLYEGHTGVARLGSHQGRVAAAAERLGQVPVVRTKRGTVRLTDANPTHVIFRLDNAQNNFFRRAVLYNAIKRQAFTDLKANVGHAQTAMAQVTDMLRLRPGETVAAQMERVLRDPAKVEQAARYVDSVLGDYLRYTARERHAFKTFVMFYGFLRYATKTLFYTLPVQHPLAASLALKVGQLHDEEIVRIFGTRDVPPWVFSRVFQYNKDGSVKRDPDGRPLSFDLARINPLTGPVTDLAQHGFPAVWGLFSPIAQAAANVASGKNLQQNRPLRVGNSAEQPKSIGLLDAGRIIANESIGSTLPGRLLMPKGTQADTALPGLPSPIRYKTAAAQERDRQRQAGKLKGLRGVEQQLFPLLVAKPDTTGDFVAAQKKKVRRASDGGWGSPSSGASNGGWG